MRWTKYNLQLQYLPDTWSFLSRQPLSCNDNQNHWTIFGLKTKLSKKESKETSDNVSKNVYWHVVSLCGNTISVGHCNCCQNTDGEFLLVRFLSQTQGLLVVFFTLTLFRMKLKYCNSIDHFYIYCTTGFIQVDSKCLTAFRQMQKNTRVKDETPCMKYLPLTTILFYQGIEQSM